MTTSFEQLSLQLWRGWAYVTSGRTLAIILGVGFALLAVFLLIASRTKWGQAKPLTKAVVLSILAHVWLLMYALGTRTVQPQGSPSGREQTMNVAFEATTEPPLSDDTQTDSAASQQTDGFPSQSPWDKAVPLAALPKPPDLQQLFEEETLPDLLPMLEPTPMPALPNIEQLSELLPSEAASDVSESADSNSQLAMDSESLSNSFSDQSVLPPPVDSNPLVDESAGVVNSTSIAPKSQMVSNNYSAVLPPDQQLPDQANLPKEYQLRQASNRLQLAQAYGADADSEAAVEAGLKWLASAQSANGGWLAAQFGAGTETHALGEYRYGTGDRADTGISGLALLAFLSAGHTHLDGEHQQTVKIGLQYLLQAQMPSGDLSGPKQVGNEPSVVNARMYCHSIATLALAEAYAMTHDAYLKAALLSAAQYSINAQDVRGGGWRYRPRDSGDLSQFGWQAMALRSIERSGIDVPLEVQRRMRRFLDSCAAGDQGGLARYRPGEGRPSETMTAESLACRLLLNYPLTLNGQLEAEQMIMRNRPGVGQDNVYFWYYATLALFQLQNENWRSWNQSMKQRLLTTQLPAYVEQAGSWDPDNMWGGYGGRVYSTAMSCLCLEVYYRYLPMYQRSNLARQPQPTNISR